MEVSSPAIWHLALWALHMQHSNLCACMQIVGRDQLVCALAQLATSINARDSAATYSCLLRMMPHVHTMHCHYVSQPNRQHYGSSLERMRSSDNTTSLQPMQTPCTQALSHSCSQQEIIPSKAGKAAQPCCSCSEGRHCSSTSQVTS